MSTPASLNLLKHITPKLSPSISSLLLRGCVPSASLLIPCRGYKPFSVLPLRFRPVKKKRDDGTAPFKHDVHLTFNHGAKKHSLRDAADLVRSYSLFAADPVELSVQIDMGEGKTKVQNRKGIVYFKNPLTQQKVLVLAEGSAAEEARNAGAAIVGGTELFKELIDGTLDYEHCIATPDFYKQMTHLGKHMRDKYPHPRRGTVTDDIADTIVKLSGGQSYEVSYEGDLRMLVAMSDFTAKQMEQNILAVMEAVDGLKHATVAGTKHWVKARLHSEQVELVPLDIADALNM